MSIYKCSNSKYKWGLKGRCIYDTREEARRAGIAIEIEKKKNMVKEIIASDDDITTKIKKLKDFFNF